MTSETDWLQFYGEFIKLNGDFIKKITEEFPDLTNAQFKLCTYIHAGCNTKEISQLMQLSVRSIENHRYRLRKKLKMKNKENLTAFLINYE